VSGLSLRPEASPWRVELQHKPALEVDAVCLALPAPHASRLLQSVDPELATDLQIPYASSAIINLADQVLLRAFVGGALHQAELDRSDAAIQQSVCQDLRQLLGITGHPIYTHMQRWPQSMAQYHLGHMQRVARIATFT
jgi:oxygen-dependent protoporphyrinogen oxidase